MVFMETAVEQRSFASSIRSQPAIIWLNAAPIPTAVVMAPTTRRADTTREKSGIRRAGFAR